MSGTILVSWTLVGFAGTNYTFREVYDWRPVGTFESVQACEQAALQHQNQN